MTLAGYAVFSFDKGKRGLHYPDDISRTENKSSMRKLAQLLSGLFLMLVFIVSITFSYFNTTPVALTFANWQIPAQPVSVWIIGAFVCGGVIGLLLGTGLVRNLRSRAEIKRLMRQLDQSKQEVAQLRAGSIRD